MPATQENRIAAIATGLGPDVLLLRSVSIQEQMGRMFQIEAELSCEKGEIVFDKVLGTNVTIRLQIGDKPRYFNGFVSRFVQGSNEGGFTRYRAEVVPWLWFLTRTADCRIFQNKSVPDIIQQVFKDHGFTDFKLNLQNPPGPREYCVQYRETDFNFVSRLMEQEGMYYHFEHTDGKHTMVIVNAPSAHKAFPGHEEVTFSELESNATGSEGISNWVVEKEVQPVGYALNDYHFPTSKTSLLASANVTRQHAASKFEIFDYPGEYTVAKEGEKLAQIRLDELQAQHEILRGQATVRGLAVGSKFKLKGHPRKDQNDREYLLTGVSIHIDNGGYATGREGGQFFTCNFRAMPLAQPFRTPRLTPKPIVQGPQTAVVVGPKGEEIYVDKFGRVKVQFHWDRYGKADENSSCYIRVAQTWAGKNWGVIQIPRIGQEVVVQFLEGDPDQPLIVGSVYNDAVMPPYPLPDRKTLSGIKTNSTIGGKGFNEVRFEDKKGDEQLFIHAEKNMDTRVKNSCFEFIGYDRHLVVKHDQNERVENNRSETVDKDHVEKIGKDRHLKVVGKEAKEVDETLSLTVKKDVTEVFKANHSEEVTKDYYLKAQNVVIEAATNITLKVGSSSLAIEAGGVGIKTSGQLKIESTGPAEIKSSATIKIEGGATADVKSPMTTINADGILTLKGALVKIN